MTQPLITTLTRNEFLDWIAGGFERISSSETPRKRTRGKDDVDIVWMKGRDHPIVSVDSGSLNEFIAFTSTYISSLRPFSAFFHVVSSEMVDEVHENNDLTSTKVANLSKIVAGGALAEAFLRGRASGSGAAYLQSMRSSLSGCLGSALIVGYSPFAMIWLTDHWNSVHVTPETPQASHKLSREVSSIWALVCASFHSAGKLIRLRESGATAAISQFLVEAVELDSVSSEMLQKLGQDLGLSIDLAEVLSAPRERRIALFSDFVSELKGQQTDAVLTTFVAGLLLAIAGNGSFEMLRSAQKLTESSPAAVVWFGICAALFRESNVLTVEGCVGRRFARDLRVHRSPFDEPECDLSVFEYQMLLREPASLDQIPSTSADQFSLELLPNVLTYTPKRQRARESATLVEAQILRASLQDVQVVLNRVQRRLGPLLDSAQPDLFSERNPRNRQR